MSAREPMRQGGRSARGAKRRADSGEVADAAKRSIAAASAGIERGATRHALR